MDLQGLNTKERAAQGIDIVIREPAAPFAKTDITIRVLGRDSSEYQNALRGVLKRQFGTEPDGEGGAIEVLAAVTLGWENVAYEGKAVEYSADNVGWLYREFPWIREQVEAAVKDRSRFFGERSNGSATQS